MLPIQLRHLKKCHTELKRWGFEQRQAAVAGPNGRFMVGKVHFCLRWYMLRWLLSEFRVRNTFWHKWQTALFSGCRCCCSLCLFSVSLVLSILPQRSHRWCDVAALPNRLVPPSAGRHRKHITSIRPPLCYPICLFLLLQLRYWSTRFKLLSV